MVESYWQKQSDKALACLRIQKAQGQTAETFSTTGSRHSKQSSPRFVKSVIEFVTIADVKQLLAANESVIQSWQSRRRSIKFRHADCKRLNQKAIRLSSTARITGPPEYALHWQTARSAAPRASHCSAYSFAGKPSGSIQNASQMCPSRSSKDRSYMNP